MASRPVPVLTTRGVTAHLRLLREAGLVTVREDGTRRIYSLHCNSLLALGQWFQQRLDALDTEVKRGRRDRRASS